MKKWYEKSSYLKFVPQTSEDWWMRVWNIFQETIDRAGLDNSMGDYNYLIGKIIYENGNYDEKEFIEKIKRSLKMMELVE